jgi:DNA-binding transcriptional ArsR family regulator
MAEQVVVLEPGGEKAQKIAKAMASQTACDILRLIGEGQITSTEISEHLSIPMNTAKYHIENLLDAGLIYVSATKYSVKGREVKVYSITNQLLIVAPSQSNVRSLLVKYASLFGMVLFGSLVLAIILAYGTSAAPRAPSQEIGIEYAKVASDAIAFTPPSALDPVVAFFFGGALVISILVFYEVYLWKKLK